MTKLTDNEARETVERMEQAQDMATFPEKILARFCVTAAILVERLQKVAASTEKYETKEAVTSKASELTSALTAIGAEIEKRCPPT
jgi:hypothetical protein